MAGAAVLGRLTTGWRVAEVVDAVDETPRVRTLVLAADGWPGHRAGQHLDVRLTAPDGYQAQRSYSVASPPGEPPAITVERSGRAHANSDEILSRRVRLGDRVEDDAFDRADDAIDDDIGALLVSVFA